MSNREEILADFQACTGIEDVGEAFLHLEEANWNLEEAVNRVLPHGSQDVAAMDQSFLSQLNNIPSVDEAVRVDMERRSTSPVIVPLPQPLQLVSMSSDFLGNRSRGSRTVLNFRVNFNDTHIDLKVPEDETVEGLKLIIHSQLGIPPCKQELSGWNTDRPPNDSVRLSALSLSRDNVLYLTVKPNVEGMNAEESKRLAQAYKLGIWDETHQQLHNINFPGTKTILEVKQDVFDLTNIPVRHQFWTGWPPQAGDDTVLAASGINFPIHNLTVSQLIKETNRPVDEQMVNDILSEDGSTADEFEDASDVVMEDMFIHDIPPSRPQPLMPEGIEDEATAAIHFVEGFTQRYGHCHPMFFPGSLDDAMKESVLQPARDRKLLAVYVHHDGSVSSNVFCTQVLCSESVVSFLTSNFVIWGWDMTLPSNRQQLLNTVARHFDNLASRTLRNVDVEKLPLLLIVTRSRATNEVLSVIQGNVNVDELMTQLLHAVEMFSEQQRIEMAEEEEREARELVKREQDEAYQASLQADRAKEELRRQEEAQRQKLEEERRKKEKHDEEIQEKVQREKEERRRMVENRLPKEPSSESSNVSTIRFRLPGGNTATRKFLAEESLQVLLDYLLVKGFPPEEYKVLSSWPRKDLTSLDSSKSLRELNLYPQDTLIIEER